MNLKLLVDYLKFFVSLGAGAAFGVALFGIIGFYFFYPQQIFTLDDVLIFAGFGGLMGFAVHNFIDNLLINRFKQEEEKVKIVKKQIEYQKKIKELETIKIERFKQLQIFIEENQQDLLPIDTQKFLVNNIVENFEMDLKTSDTGKQLEGGEDINNEDK